MQAHVQVYEIAALGNPNVNSNYKLSDPGAYTLTKGEEIFATGHTVRDREASYYYFNNTLGKSDVRTISFPFKSLKQELHSSPLYHLQQ
jgi:hypothetical protein